MNKIHKYKLNKDKNIYVLKYDININIKYR